MSRIFAVARGCADTMKTGVWDETLLPRSFELTAERLQRTLDAQAEFEAKYGPDGDNNVSGHVPKKANGHGLVHSLGEKVAAVTIQA
jgi:hypothetical protein